MVKACFDSGCSLFTNYIRRSDPGGIEVARRLHAGEIRSPIKGVAWYSKGLYNNGSHLVNLLQYWLGDVTGFKVVSRGRDWEGTDPEPDLEICFESGNVSYLLHVKRIIHTTP
jgi:predicted dehydrogenase